MNNLHMAHRDTEGPPYLLFKCVPAKEITLGSNPYLEKAT